mmetsp:Transcript_20867/g.62262  ORF Transcript_20867/g.62262 Transcript_20867/m.62262 type:complete len:104 (+) Transcript_20867:65-376(+)
MSRVAVTEAQSTKAWERGLMEVASGLGCLLSGKPASTCALAVLWAFTLVRIASVDATSALRAAILLAATVGHLARNVPAVAARGETDGDKRGRAEGEKMEKTE